jgi:hypothetical protein
MVTDACPLSLIVGLYKQEPSSFLALLLKFTALLSVQPFFLHEVKVVAANPTHTKNNNFFIIF